MVIYVDIDETICNTPSLPNSNERDYYNSTPIQEHINKVNSMYEDGHKIVYWTARGSTTGKNWEDLTRKQLSEWGVKFHAVKFWKPFYDVFIDDKNINAKDLLSFQPKGGTANKVTTYSDIVHTKYK